MGDRLVGSRESGDNSWEQGDNSEEFGGSDKIMSSKFENLNAWKTAKELVLFVYGITDKYPQKEQFALTSQTTRAAVSIVANIAEGSSRSSNKDFAHFLEISIGSLFELEALVEIAHARNYCSTEDKEVFDRITLDTIRLIYGLKRKINER